MLYQALGHFIGIEDRSRSTLNKMGLDRDEKPPRSIPVGIDEFEEAASRKRECRRNLSVNSTY